MNRLERQKKPRKKLKILGALGLFSILVWLVFRMNPLVIKSVDIETGNLSCLGNFSESDLHLQGQNILLVNTQSLKTKLIAKFPCIEDITLTRESINKVKVNLAARTPLVYITNIAPESSPGAGVDTFLQGLSEATPSSTTALIDWSFVNSGQTGNLVADNGGWIFSQPDALNLPTLFTVDQDVQAGKQIKGNLLGDVDTVLNKLPGLGIMGDNLKMLGSGDNLFIGSNPKLAFSTQKDILRQLISLQLILQKAKIDEGTPETVDLRFDKPVIIYGKRPSTMRN